ncbi:VOC family protein [Leptothoe spongobia]|uniref:VOC family protein n=1 Tax=Leptothoe spongobia TAU-MAC 1115 TaxID=1967444 RepID=A0A947DI36_9CYAN|nr:VOC family protein [Leptothoe spongobia]MBT9317386.1 VOC family protein [Leptothoe spongobia TAU-MAC 1115]
MKPQPLIAVHDVSSSRNWYENVLGLRSGHGGDKYERMMHGDRIVLQLHRWDAHEHLHLGDPSVPIGNGAVLWFQTDRFDEIVDKAQAFQARILEGPQINSNANHREIWLSDPDDYTVVIAGTPGDV